MQPDHDHGFAAAQRPTRCAAAQAAYATPARHTGDALRDVSPLRLEVQR